jgi:hypothetical protein
MAKMYIGPHVQYPLFLSDFNETLHIPIDLRKIQKILNFMNIHPVGAEMYHLDGRTDEQTEGQTLIS